MSTNNSALVHGTPMDGFKVTGPFVDSDAANEYADFSKHDYWWVTEISAPDGGATAQGSFVLAHGSLFDGLSLVGPFQSMSLTTDYAEKAGFKTWWGVEMLPVPDLDASPSPWA